MQSSNSIQHQPDETGSSPVNNACVPQPDSVQKADHTMKLTAHMATKSTEAPEPSHNQANESGYRSSVDLSKKAVTTGKKQHKAADMLKAKKTPGSI